MDSTEEEWLLVFPSSAAPAKRIQANVRSSREEPSEKRIERMGRNLLLSCGHVAKEKGLDSHSIAIKEGYPRSVVGPLDHLDGPITGVSHRDLGNNLTHIQVLPLLSGGRDGIQNPREYVPGVSHIETESIVWILP